MKPPCSLTLSALARAYSNKGPYAITSCPSVPISLYASLSCSNEIFCAWYSFKRVYISNEKCSIMTCTSLESVAATIFSSCFFCYLMMHSFPWDSPMMTSFLEARSAIAQCSGTHWPYIGSLDLKNFSMIGMNS